MKILLDLLKLKVCHRFHRFINSVLTLILIATYIRSANNASKSDSKSVCGLLKPKTRSIWGEGLDKFFIL
jgi:hypothetical protein